MYTVRRRVEGDFMNKYVMDAVEAGPVTRQIERYYQEKLDKRPGRNGPSASLFEQMLSLN